MDIDDLHEKGYISIIKAVSNFDMSKNSSFTSYVMYAIKNNYFYSIRKCASYNSNISMHTPADVLLYFNTEGITLKEIAAQKA